MLKHKSSKVLLGLGALLLTGVLTTSAVRAQENSPGGGIAQRIAERFGLQTSDVQQVFDEVQTEHRQQMRSHQEERLNQLVEEGTITEEQKQALLEKRAEMQVDRGDCQILSPEERETSREQHQAEMKSWLEENGLDESIFSLMGRCGKGPGSGFGGGYLMKGLGE